MDCCGGDVRVFDQMDQEDDINTLGGLKPQRNCTDKPFLYAMGGFFIVLIVLLGYCMATGDIDRLINGYDDCGNICGKNNKNTSHFECFGQDMTKKKFLLYKSEQSFSYNYTTKTCVENCKNQGSYIEFLNRCIPVPKNTSNNNNNNNNDDDVVKEELTDFFQEITEDFQMTYKYIILLTFLALVFSVIMLVLLRYATAFMVWFVLMALAGTCIGITTLLWVLFKNSKNEANVDTQNILLFYAIFVTIFTVVLLLIIMCMFKRIKLVIQLFKESAKAIAAMPLILFQPVLTFLALFIILFCGFYFSMWIYSSGNLEKLSDSEAMIEHAKLGSLDYVQTTAAIFTNWYNYVAILWMIQFVIGCQHMIIGGCVAAWFFTRNKSQLESPILMSTMNVIKYHLGTIALGSLIITIVEVIKTIVRGLQNSFKNQKNFLTYIMYFCLRYVLDLIEQFLKYFSRNAYIQTAIYGHTFCTGGKRAFKLLMNNIFKVVAINSVGDYVLFFIKMFVVAITVLVGYAILQTNDKIHYIWFPLVIVGLITIFISHCFVTVFEMTIDTIFLCFCEDCEQNDGLSKPYFMSRNLMEFVENSNKLLNSKNWDAADQQAWDNGPKRLLQQGS